METDKILIRVDVRDVDYINKIIEAYDGLGIVHTVNSREGIVAVHVTPDTAPDVLAILKHLRVNIEFL
ncbi:MAG TPA: DUF4911 domain-containing protein [Firmicutes bacterium]|nr:DUF4911 domain-containing protein [Bacillota bacterium]